ncbi:bifunctional 2',3'-cyclic-nucleotide 2'-phosphodiesterase/3'-nucleotidase [Sporosarcina trichiuri]|uniref:bifunctional 2',3'-cyclic-nucleotide 2'-phosphodiesterase/3'-nucleotidase n=1 Tax=Sporosarcina trichiuri TaxID=3056445 RepID=UPI0025B4FF3D|nr:bifunctional 2',3'-cyclic-nucleotide 2'-phosphodiesterase/3'-nucleotidase [Sporosarcina sp. 0.2-SM1T-5]WJY26185.1 bifunctional 2',3'-cyclic-nucleotide 2'-phosphodiesterase/3'-nucleotidase [Sporosarcina sp. 0.2-SM1T-5]
MTIVKKIAISLLALLVVAGGLFIPQPAKAANQQEAERGEFIQKAVTALNLPMGDGSSITFKDVDKQLAPYVEAAVTAGLVHGRSASVFDPHGPLTREQAFVIAARAAKTENTYSLKLLDRFKDKRDFGASLRPEMAKSIGLGIMKGYADKTAKPKQPVMKNEMRAIVSRLVKMSQQYPGTPDSGDATVAFRIMGTTDIHTNLMNYDYYQDKTIQDYGLAKTGVLIDEARAEVKNSLLFDNGDLIQGTPLGSYKVKESPLQKGEVHPTVAALNALDYDVMSLGNHEFNFGLDYLDNVIEGADFPVLNANIYDEKTGKNRFTPYVILDKDLMDSKGKTHAIKIGVIGVVAPGIMRWDGAHLSGKVRAEDAADTVEKFIPQVKKEGADLVFVIAHSGIGDEHHEKNEDDVTWQISALDGVDGILTGHNHAKFPGDYADVKNTDMKQGTINGTPVVMPDRFGTHLGLLDYELKLADGKWTVVSGKGSLREVHKESDEVNQKVVDAVKEAHEGTLGYIRTPVSKTTAPLTSYFGLVRDDSSIQIVTEAQKHYVKEHMKGTEYDKLPLLSAGSPLKFGGRYGSDYYTDIPAGDVSIKNMADLYVYDNTVAAVVLKGRDIKEWLEMSAGAFRQVDPAKAEEQNILNENHRSYNFDVIDGLTYEIDLTEPAKYDSKEGKLLNENANRIKNLQYEDKPIDPDQEFVVVTNNYRGSGNFPGVRNAKDVIFYQDENREAIIDYLADQEQIDPKVDNNWFIQPVDGAKMIFETSVRGKEHIGNDPRIKFLENTKDGYAKYELK